MGMDEYNARIAPATTTAAAKAPNSVETLEAAHHAALEAGIQTYRQEVRVLEGGWLFGSCVQVCSMVEVITAEECITVCREEELVSARTPCSSGGRQHVLMWVCVYVRVCVCLSGQARITGMLRPRRLLCPLPPCTFIIFYISETKLLQKLQFF
jgi:hypothetical protein